MWIRPYSPCAPINSLKAVKSTDRSLSHPSSSTFPTPHSQLFSLFPNYWHILVFQVQHGDNDIDLSDTEGETNWWWPGSCLMGSAVPPYIVFDFISFWSLLRIADRHCSSSVYISCDPFRSLGGRPQSPPTIQFLLATNVQKILQCLIGFFLRGQCYLQWRQEPA